MGVSQCLLKVGLDPPQQEEISFWDLGALGCEKGIQLLRWGRPMLSWEHNSGVSKTKLNTATELVTEQDLFCFERFGLCCLNSA